MKKKNSGALTIAALLIIGGAIIYYFISSSYTTTEDLYEFPVPRYAELIKTNEQGISYAWSRVSEENGIPYGYVLALKTNGWKKEEREGARK
ncbi:hypothetical protein P4646_25825 [Peribacillus simplex]|uniref:hypothetical protein n=1 Tax=Peribacillus simplex TaxID=1478 RepID=UPI002E212FDE|nr:hypothetical protein [Peribacillus simplex]MED4092834.1 hypothetical protein [Peribacillus simplex]